MEGPPAISPGAPFKRMGTRSPQMVMRMRRQAFRPGEMQGPGFEQPWRGSGRGAVLERRWQGPAKRDGVMDERPGPREFGREAGAAGAEPEKYVTVREFKAAMRKIMARLDTITSKEMKPDGKRPRPDAGGPKPERQGRLRRGERQQRPGPERPMDPEE
jgi:hypothetical protein